MGWDYIRLGSSSALSFCPFFGSLKPQPQCIRGGFIDLRCIKSSTSNFSVATERLFEDDVYWSGAAKKMHFKTSCLELKKWEEVM